MAYNQALFWPFGVITQNWKAIVNVPLTVYQIICVVDRSSHILLKSVCRVLLLCTSLYFPSVTLNSIHESKFKAGFMLHLLCRSFVLVIWFPVSELLSAHLSQIP